MGSFECVSRCEVGMRLDRSAGGCRDVDECAVGGGGAAACFGGMRCVNTVGSYRCDCPDGFRVDGDTGQCEDVDECADAR